ncbi:DUF4186 family protein [Nocardioides sp. P5_E3]
MPDPAEIDDRLDRASARPFGRRFHLRGRERATAELRGPQTMRAHAAEIIAERLAPAEPRNDGRQTPYRNHPVFVAQRAPVPLVRRRGLLRGRPACHSGGPRSEQRTPVVAPGLRCCANPVSADPR